MAETVKTKIEDEIYAYQANCRTTIKDDLNVNSKRDAFTTICWATGNRISSKSMPYKEQRNRAARQKIFTSTRRTPAAQTGLLSTLRHARTVSFALSSCDHWQTAKPSWQLPYEKQPGEKVENIDQSVGIMRHSLELNSSPRTADLMQDEREHEFGVLEPGWNKQPNLRFSTAH